MSNTILYRMDAGIPGDVSRKDALTAEPRVMGATPLAAFGLAGQLDGSTNTILPMASGASAWGMLMRPYPAQSTTNDLGEAAPEAGKVCDIMRRGYMTVKNLAGTPAAGGTVYVQVVATTGKPVGSISAEDDSGNREVLTGAKFMGPADDNGNVEIAYNI
jgi:hypothetical protein